MEHHYEDPDPAPEQLQPIQDHDPSPIPYHVGPKCWNYKNCKNMATEPQYDPRRLVNAPKKTVCYECCAYYQCLGPESSSHQYGNCNCLLVDLYDPLPLPESEIDSDYCLYRNDPSCNTTLIDSF